MATIYNSITKKWRDSETGKEIPSPLKTGGRKKKYYGNERTVPKTIRLTPSHITVLTKEFGSVQRFVDINLERIGLASNSRKPKDVEKNIFE